MRKLSSIEGDPLQGVLLAVDISERKQAEQRALEHQRVRDFHFDNTPLAVIEWTPEFRVSRWSRHAERIFGWTEAEVLGKDRDTWTLLDLYKNVAADALLAYSNHWTWVWAGISFWGLHMAMTQGLLAAMVAVGVLINIHRQGVHLTWDQLPVIRRKRRWTPQL